MIEQSKFSGHAVVEVMGHQQHAGLVTTEAFGSIVIFRIVTPEIPPTERVLSDREWIGGRYYPPGTRIVVSRARSEVLVGAGSIYRITPCSEEEATASGGLLRQEVTFVPDGAGLLPGAVVLDGDDEEGDDDHEPF